MSDPPKEAKSIFLAALEIADSAERAAFVERTCDNDAALRQRVEDLLRAYGQSGGPLDKFAAALAPTQQGEPIREQVGATIGPYKLMEQIGEGGFGLVFVAEQERPIRRKVALKIIKPGMDTRDVIARFEAERQALALMDHPNIARVLDAGTTESGRPYFVMELVRGVPITDYCDKNQLTPRERLELFVPVCNAIQHAHLKGIIHRDIKPSNVLVTMHDGKPVVKVIDFGVAKALHQSLTDRTVYTRFAQMIGTPLYMSPEQAEMSGLDIDTRTDVYSLGVLLYELLTGLTPFDKKRLAQAAYDDLLRIIREEDPPKPSLRLSQSSDSLPSIAAQRKTEPAKLSKMFSGDLDWIAMKALEKDRTRRYETANAFAADVLRYLNDEPVEASPPSAAYRIRKFARKHRRAVIAVASTFAVLVLGIVGTTWGLFRAQRAERAADASKTEAIAALDQVTKERDEKEIARRAEAAERERAERQFANGLLRPIGFGIRDVDWGWVKQAVLNEGELGSFAEWSAIKESRMKLLVLELALENPEAALRLARRAERAIQSCVGLSPTRRARALEIVSLKQRDMTVDPRIRVAACWLALELGSADLPAWAESCQFTADPRNHSGAFAEFIDCALSRTDPQQIAQLNADPLLSILESKWSAASATVRGKMPILGPRLDSAQTTRCVDVLIAMVEKGRELPRTLVWDDAMASHSALLEVQPRFRGIVPHMAQKEADRAADALITILNGSEPAHILCGMSEGLADLVPRLDPERAGRVADSAIAYLRKNPGDRLHYGTEEQAQAAAVDLWRGLALKIEPARVERIGKVLLAILEKSDDGSAAGDTIDALNALAPRIETAQVTRVGDALISVLKKPPHWENLAWVESASRAYAPRLQAAQVSRLTDAVLALMRKWMANRDRKKLARDLEDPPKFLTGSFLGVAPRLEPAQAKDAWDALMDFDSPVRNEQLSECRSAAAGRLNAREAEQVGDSLIAVLDKSPEPKAECLRALAPRLTEQQIRRANDRLIGMLERQPRAAATGLKALAPRLDSRQAAQAWDALFPKVREDPLPLERVEALSSLVGRIDAARLARSAQELCELSTQLDGRSKSQLWRQALIEILRRLEPVQARRIWDEFMAVAEARPQLAYDATLALSPSLPPPSRDELSTRATQFFFDYAALVNTQEAFEGSSSLERPLLPVQLVRSICSPRSLARLLSHPACVEANREFLLQRFEEVVFHQGKPVFLQAAEKPEAKDNGKPDRPARRFHNLHDASSWIHQNWPDFDLETNSPVTWRGSR